MEGALRRFTHRRSVQPVITDPGVVRGVRREQREERAAQQQIASRTHVDRSSVDASTFEWRRCDAPSTPAMPLSAGPSPRRRRVVAARLQHRRGTEAEPAWRTAMHEFLRALEEQRWDDHRYYHHSRVNQSLHLLSAICFLCSYVLLFRYPAAAALVGWLLAMVSRQIGHFFFEPKGFDEVNQATHEYKEEVKVGYNLRR